MTTPAVGSAQVFGGPSNGCLQGAQALPVASSGLISVRRHRNHYYGHPALIDLLLQLGRDHATSADHLIMIGDLSQPRGGPMSSLHRSHQNGLDVDIWLTFAKSTQHAQRLTGTQADPPSLVTTDGQRPTQQWGMAQVQLVQWLAQRAEVDRLFIHPVLKQALCQAQPNAHWLRKVRPWWGHDAHVHVRLRCPNGSPHCQGQAPLPPGTGCGAPLAWWFSAEARQPRSKGKGSTTSAVMPSACQKLIHAP
jgi:penicillin-insensitive murein endopeptidase